MPITHIAVTIGPIYDLMKKTKTIRELWVSSYFYSKLSSYFIENNFPHLTLLSPQPVKIDKCRNGAGVYPDRIYWSVDKEWTNNFEEMINNAFDYMVNQSSFQITKEDLFKYIKIYFTSIDSKIYEGEFIPMLNMSLDALELENQWAQDGQSNIIEKIIAKGRFSDPSERPVYKWREESICNCQNSVYKNYTTNGIKRYPSIIETATIFLKNSDENSIKNRMWYKENVEDIIAANIKSENKADSILDGELMPNIKEQYSDIFKSYHKYICFIRADGDGIGNSISEFVKSNKNEEFKEISNTLNNYSIDATERIKNYGGIPIYSSGDDLLFYAPVMHQTDESNSILHLLKELNIYFKQLLSSHITNNTPTLSFGVSIVYYKHPMKEMLENSYNLLFHKAKLESGKNSIAMKFQKHSGQTFELCLKINSNLFKTVLNLVSFSINKDENFINSLTYKLDDQKTIIALISDNKERLLVFFEKNFSESFESNMLFFEHLSDLIIEIFKNNNCIIKLDLIKTVDREILKICIDNLYSILRFIHFLNANDTDE